MLLAPLDSRPTPAGMLLQGAVYSWQLLQNLVGLGMLSQVKSGPNTGRSCRKGMLLGEQWWWPWEWVYPTWSQQKLCPHWECHPGCDEHSLLCSCYQFYLLIATFLPMLDFSFPVIWLFKAFSQFFFMWPLPQSSDGIIHILELRNQEVSKQTDGSDFCFSLWRSNSPRNCPSAINS